MHLAKLLRSGGNLLLLDEPTNDLDVDTLRALENALLAFPGCAIVISHDRWFLDRVATHVLAFEGDSQVTLVRGQLRGLRGAPPRAARRRRRPAPPHHLQAARAWLSGQSPARGRRGPASSTATRPSGASGRSRDADERCSRAEVSPDWRAGRGPHGGYLAAMLLRALIETVDDAARAPRSLTIHYARAPEPGPVRITHDDRARGALAEHALGADGAGRQADRARARGLLGPVGAARRSPTSRCPTSRRPTPSARPGTLIERGAPPFTRAHRAPAAHGRRAVHRRASSRWRSRGWLGLAEPRPIDALSLAFFSDALIPAAVHAPARAGGRADGRPDGPLPRAACRGVPRARPGRAVPRALTRTSSSTKASSRRTA